MTEAEIESSFSEINCWSSGDTRAPNKPLLLITALAAVQNGDRWIAFNEFEQRFRQILLDFGPQRDSQHPEYAFWRLQKDGIWSIPVADKISEDLTSKGDAKVTTLRKLNAKAGFSDQIYDQLRNSPHLVLRCAQTLLENAFPESLHSAILQAIGLSTEEVGLRKRDTRFRKQILRIYERRCAICSYDGQLGQSVLGLEAAHIKWHAAGGPDLPANGIALCSFHHTALDRGALGFDDTLRILVSQDVTGGNSVNDLLLRWSGCSLREPLLGTESPAVEFVRWHRREVFHHPARSFPSE